ncbi:MAG: hypothetical protein IT204_18925 [Fimbriimonadaceae bacterium]|nr:hypothetical protein [Fimbriimonadaceae bacterium]
MRAAAVLFLVLAIPAPGRAEVALGTFTPAPACTLYVVGDGQPLTLRLQVKQTQTRETERLLVRLYDPAERLVWRRWVEWVPAADLPTAAPPAELEVRPSEQPPAVGELLLSSEWRLPIAGVWQLRLLAGARVSQATVTADRLVPYGVSFQNGDWTPWDRTLRTAWLALPAHTEELTVSGGPVRVTAGERLVGETAKGAPAVTWPVAVAPARWQVELPRPADFTFRAGPGPVILCNTAAAAERIGGSTIQTADGTVVCHEFQRRILALLPRLLAPDLVGRAADLKAPLATRRAAWLADPGRSLILREAFLPLVERLLDSQNVDPTSHWGGSLDGWQAPAAKSEREGRWDRLHGLPGLWAGASARDSADAYPLALAALADDPTNPYHGRRELLQRAAAAALRDLLLVTEAETFPGIADFDPYPGNMAFALGQKTLPVYGLAAPHVDPAVRALWTEAVSHLVDRHLVDPLTTARNQSSHHLVAFQSFANGSGDPYYRELARLFARRWMRGQSAAGYHMEATGPCGSYIGMTHWHEAVYYRLSGDAAILDSLRRSYTFFNHTVAPEPDGRLLGGFNFNHRVGDGFCTEQWNGARGILDDLLPEVGLWATAVDPASARAEVEKFLAAPRPPLYAALTTPRWLWYAAADRSGVWPARETNSFVRQFGDELVAVKRPGYYAVIYTGKPAAGAAYLPRKESLRTPFAGDLESTGGVLPDMRSITPFGGGGLSGFWTPAYGHSLLAANWSPTTHHGLIATVAGKRWWEDYFAHSQTLDAAAGSLTLRGQVEGQPLTYERTYGFGEQGLEVTSRLTATAAWRGERLVENLPYARGGWKARGATLSAGDQTSGAVTASELRLTDSSGAGIKVTFEQPQRLRLVPEGLRAGGWRLLQIGRAEVELPTDLAAGQSAVLRYRLAPLP